MSWWHLVPWWLIVAALVLVLAVLFAHVSARVAGIAALAIALLFSGYRWGATAVENAWQAKDDKRVQAEANARESERLRGEKASGALQAQLLQLSIDNDQLTGAFNDYKRKHPLVVVRASARAAQPAGDGAQPPGAAPAAAPIELVPADAAVYLTRGAVWMWNSALAQRDTPAGACGLADTSEAACAAVTSIGLEDAWDNQALNARLCAEDRVRHQALIDFIKRKKQ